MVKKTSTTWTDMDFKIKQNQDATLSCDDLSIVAYQYMWQNHRIIQSGKLHIIKRPETKQSIISPLY